MPDAASANPAGVPPLALPAARVIADVFPGVFSLRAWRSLDAGAKCPRGFFPGGGRRKCWRTSDLAEWAALEFPCRREFEQRVNGEKAASDGPSP